MDADEVMSLEEVEKHTGMSRATIYNYMKKLGIKPYKFDLDRRTYLAAADVKRIREYRKDPRKVGATAKVKIKPEEHLA
jgi:predicted DNA-binding transcriptional regulator AlpA